MKTLALKSSLCLLVLLLLSATNNIATAKKIDFKKLPKIAQDFYTEHFGTKQIKEVDFDAEDKEYEIELWNDTSIKFNQKGEWIEVDCDKGENVPNSVIKSLPKAVVDKITSTYKGSIKEVKRNLKDVQNTVYKFKLYAKPGDVSPVYVVIDSKGNFFN